MTSVPGAMLLMSKETVRGVELPLAPGYLVLATQEGIAIGLQVEEGIGMSQSGSLTD